MSGIDLGLDGKNVLVLGGGQGMGESSALRLAEAGCNVAVADLEGARADRVSALVTERGTRSLPLVVDALDEAALVESIARAERELGDLHGLVTIIGMAHWSPLVELTTDAWDLDHLRNVRYFFVAAREVAASLIRRGAPGSIVCIASMDGIRSAPYHAAYGVAKAGLINLVKSASAEWGPHGIRVNAVAPGTIITPRTSAVNRPANEHVEEVPMHRRGSTDEIAKAVLFFISDLSSYVTGQTLAVDGGVCAVGPVDYAASMEKIGAGRTMGMREQGAG